MRLLSGKLTDRLARETRVGLENGDRAVGVCVCVVCKNASPRDRVQFIPAVKYRRPVRWFTRAGLALELCNGREKRIAGGDSPLTKPDNCGSHVGSVKF